MRRVLSIVLAVLVALAAGALFLAREQVAELIYRETVSSGSESLFIGAQDVAQLETVAVVYKTVFPHDYFLEGARFYALLDRVRDGDAPAEEVLTPAELDHFQAVNLAQSLGLATTPGEAGYVVVTNTLRYGYDLSQLEPHIRSEIARTAGDASTAVPPGTGPIPIPPAGLLSHETEDITHADYPYSPVYLDAEGWQLVTRFISQRHQRAQPDEDIIDQATTTGIELLEALTNRSFRVVEPTQR